MYRPKGMIWFHLHVKSQREGECDRVKGTHVTHVDLLCFINLFCNGNDNEVTGLVRAQQVLAGKRKSRMTQGALIMGCYVVVIPVM